MSKSRKSITYLHTSNMKWIAEINERARAEGLTYGQYIVKYGEAGCKRKRKKRNDNGGRI